MDLLNLLLNLCTGISFKPRHPLVDAIMNTITGAEPEPHPMMGPPGMQMGPM